MGADMTPKTAAAPAKSDICLFQPNHEDILQIYRKNLENPALCTTFWQSERPQS
jgi:hypothetical protein